MDISREISTERLFECKYFPLSIYNLFTQHTKAFLNPIDVLLDTSSYEKKFRLLMIIINNDQNKNYSTFILHTVK